MTTATLSTNAGKTIAKKSEMVLENDLSAFAHRFPVSGRIVHAVSSEVGGVLALADLLEAHGIWPQVEGWMATGKPTTISAETIYAVFGAPLIDRTARHLDIPVESVEIQLALGIPKFFAALAVDEDDELGLGFGASKKAKNKNRGNRNSSANRSGISP